MNPLEPLNEDAVVSLDNPDDKFHIPRCVFQACEMRYMLCVATRKVQINQDKWFCDGIACEVLIPHHAWRSGKATFQLCFVEDCAEDNKAESQQPETKNVPLLFKHSLGLMEIPDRQTAVISIDDTNDSFRCISRTCLLPQVAGTVLKTYEPDQLGYRWFGEGVPCSVLSPKNSWRRGKVSLQICFVKDVIEEVAEELVEEEAVETKEAEAGSDTSPETLSPLDEIRQMSDELR